jgi:cyclic-di-AMP phosphodiesterase PgpH
MMTAFEISPQKTKRFAGLRLGLFSMFFVVTATVIMAYPAIMPSANLLLTPGQVATTDILAPISLTFESTVLTRTARQLAADGVPQIYDPPDPAIVRQQVGVARRLLDYIANVRADTFGTPEQRLADLSSIRLLKFSPLQQQAVLDLGDAAWEEVDSQVMGLLERMMRNEIREGEVATLASTIPNLINLSLNEQQADLSVVMVTNLLLPNAFFNQERTSAARQQASAEVKPVTRSFVQGQVVVRGGVVVTESDLEALTQLGLTQPRDQRLLLLLGSGLLALVVVLSAVIYSRVFALTGLTNRHIAFCGVMMLLALLGGRVFVTADGFIAHLYPWAAFTLLMIAVIGPQIAFMMTFGLAVMGSVIANNSLEFMMFIAFGGLGGVFALRQTERISNYFRAGLAIGGLNAVITLAFALLGNKGESVQLLQLLAAAIMNGFLASGLALVGLYLAGVFLNTPTTLRLIELAQPNQPLLQRLLREAPGTYQHSLQVANLAELAAERIGADANLVRVGALYHDVGKLHNPGFFAENQAEGVNPHEVMPPETSAQMIIAHVTEGMKIARRHRLPKAFIDLIMQHHGTTKALFFYAKALEAANGDSERINEAIFTYPGPIPQTREAGILMLADASETIVRAKRIRDKAEIAKTVAEIIQMRQDGTQLDDSGLTVGDLHVIREVFVETLQGVFHPRIVYPTMPPKNITQEMQPYNDDPKSNQ